MSDIDLSGSFPELTFSMGDRGAPGVIYATSDPKVNHVVFTIGTNVSNAMLVPGTLVPPSQAGQSTGTLVYVDLTPLGVAPGDLATLSVSDPKWTMATYAITGPPAHSYIGLTPAVQLPLGKDSPLSIPIEGMAMAHPSQLSMHQLPVSTYRVSGVTNGDDPLPGTLGVTLTAPPGGHKNLHDVLRLDVRPDTVITSNDGAHPVANALSFTLASTADATIERDDKTEFVLSFPYADPPGYGALATVHQATGFTVRTKAGTAGWTITSGTDQQDPSWLLLPESGKPIHQGFGVVAEFEVAALETTLRPGATVLILAYRAVPGYDDGAFVASLEKLPQAIIKSFGVTPNPAVLVHGKVEVTVSWDADASQVTLYEPNGRVDPVSTSGSCTTTIRGEESFSLEAEGRGPGNRALCTVSARVFPIGETAYVSSRLSSEITPVEFDSLTVGKGISVGQASEWIASDPTGEVAYVCGNSGIIPVYLDTSTVGALKPLPAVHNFMSISPEGDFALLVQWLDNFEVRLLKLSLPGLEQLWSASVSASNVVVAPDGLKAYVLAPDESAILVFGVSGANDGHVLSRIEMAFPWCAVVSPDNSTLLVVDDIFNDTYVVPVAIATDTPRAPIAIPGASLVSDIDVTPDGTRVYVTGNSASVYGLELATGTVLSVPVGHTSSGIAIAYNTAGVLLAMVSSQSDSTVTAFTIPDHTVAPDIAVGGEPTGLAVRTRRPQVGGVGPA